MQYKLVEPTEPFDAFAMRLQDECSFAYPYVEGEPAVYGAPLVLDPAFYARLNDAAERIGALYDELVSIVWAEPELLDTYFFASNTMRAMFLASRGHWHGFGRIDVFLCTSGEIKVVEFNADVPTGQVEAIRIGAMVAADYPELDDPNAAYEARFFDMVDAYVEAQREGSALHRVGVLYPTDLPEDLSLIGMYIDWLEARGLSHVLGSPYNLGLDEAGRLTMFGQPIDLLLRHYKTDWWAERYPIFINEEPLPDPEPLTEALGYALRAEIEGRCTVINPFGSMLPQNKLAMAFFHDHKERFSEASRATIDALIPETRRVIDLDLAALVEQRASWVLKSDYGCEGEEVMVGAYTGDEEWAGACRAIEPRRWVAQRFIDIELIEAEESAPNFGVYLVAGQASGLYIRMDKRGSITDECTRALPVLVSPAPL